MVSASNITVIYWPSIKPSISRCTCVNKRKNSGSRWAWDNNITRCPDSSSQLETKCWSGSQRQTEGFGPSVTHGWTAQAKMRKKCCYDRKKNLGWCCSLSLLPTHLSHAINITLSRIKCERYIFYKEVYSFVHWSSYIMFDYVSAYICITAIQYFHVFVAFHFSLKFWFFLHSLERAAASIGLYVNAHKTEYMCYNQTGDISTLEGTPLKLVDKFTYLGSSVESTEKDIETRLTKACTAINRLSIIWKSDLTDKMKRSFFQAAVALILLYGCTTWTLTKRLEKKLDGNYTRMLRAILNKSWQQHPTRHQLYGPPAPYHENYSS